MSVVEYVGFVGVIVVVALGVRWYDSTVVEQLSRRTGLDGAKGWAVFCLAVAWMSLPVLAGAMAGDGELWAAGSTIAGVGIYLVVLAVTSVDEYRLLRRVEHVAPTRLRTGLGDVATSGIPSPSNEDAAVTPFTGVPSVHTDWIAQRRTRLGPRNAWRNAAGGTTNAEFTLGNGAVAVTSGRNRVFSNAETITTFGPDDPLPDAAESFLRDHPDLPDPGEREEELRFVETFVPADEPVTVVGTPRRGKAPGRFVVDEASPDPLLGTHTDHSSSDGDDAEAILVRGDADEARSRLGKRVYWFGGVGAAMTLGGQVLAFVLSPATVTALF